MNLVIVESPAKAKTINKYLGKDYQVLASFGHVRDLPSKDGSVQPDQDFAMTYEVDADSKKHISAIAKAVKGSDKLILATDPDREGEAISWHVLEALRESKALPKKIEVERVVFNEITKKAIVDAMKHPREIDMSLVNAQQARRALDYLTGFTLSPVLWRKLPGSKSAGRVQSVALRLICDRDEEIEKFISQEYWDIRAVMANGAGTAFKAKLSEWHGKKLDKFDIPNAKTAKEIVDALLKKQYQVASIEPKQVRRHPYPPFTTSTLQQDASRKLGFSAKKTMQLAQKLYEGVDIGGETTGLITYMRTDGVTVSQDAIEAARKHIAKEYGDKYMPATQRVYKVKQKNAQEAHEAIRPTDVTRTPEQVESVLDRDMFRLYELVWKRMMASQMESAVFDQMAVGIESQDKQALFRAVGSVMRFDGFLTLYQESKDDDEQDEESRALPPLEMGESVKTQEIVPEQHFTEPPPRYTEASLVKKLEELSIGRPSTYAAIISVLQERDYVKLEKKRFIAEARGRIVNAFLVSFFRRYVEYDFTARLEEQLDEISAGTIDWKKVLRDWWEAFIATVGETKQLTNPQVLEAVDAMLEPYIYRNVAAGTDPRACPSCGTGRLGLKTGKFGAFLGCSNYPECNYTKQLSNDAPESGESTDSNTGSEPQILGTDPASGLEVSLRKGPYGMYVQLGADKKPKRSSLPKTLAPDQVTLEAALALLSLPREIGKHPESGKMITAGLGRFGPYLLHDGKYTSLKGDDDVLTVGINRAVTLIAEKKSFAKSTVTPLKILGSHPEGGEVAIYGGRYGNYVKHGNINATLPKDSEPESFTLEEAITLLAGKSKSSGGKKKTFAVKKKKAAKAK
ncbi:MAG TPA: type I DNA topoisomerase [Rickettsiales bacterium]|nr:type I DNA topoisomerase [Rickettsiales bacterium]